MYLDNIPLYNQGAGLAKGNILATICCPICDPSITISSVPGVWTHLRRPEPDLG